MEVWRRTHLEEYVKMCNKFASQLLQHTEDWSPLVFTLWVGNHTMLIHLLHPIAKKILIQAATKLASNTGFVFWENRAWDYLCPLLIWVVTFVFFFFLLVTHWIAPYLFIYLFWDIHQIYIILDYINEKAYPIKNQIHFFNQIFKYFHFQSLCEVSICTSLLAIMGSNSIQLWKDS